MNLLNKKNIVFRSSILLNLILVFTFLFLFIKVDGISYVKSKFEEGIKFEENPHYIERMSLFKELKIPKGSIVFVGDSITQRGIWEELFPEQTVINRGINGDTTEGVLSRIDEIVASNPSKVFLMIGVNDILFDKTNEEIIGNYREILSKIKKNSEIEVFVQSVLPVNNVLYGNGINNEKLKEFNEDLLILTKEFNYSYLDIYSAVEKDNQLNVNYAHTDGIHLNGEGYNKWKHMVNEYVEN